MLMVRWLLRKGPTRSHSELGRETLPRQWYFSLSCGRVGHCRTFYILSIFTFYFYLPFFTSYLSYRPLPPCGLFFYPFLLFLKFCIPLLLWTTIVASVVTEALQDISEVTPVAIKLAEELGFASSGNELIITAGIPFAKQGNTNILHIAKVE